MATLKGGARFLNGWKGPRLQTAVFNAGTVLRRLSIGDAGMGGSALELACPLTSKPSSARPFSSGRFYQRVIFSGTEVRGHQLLI